MKWYPVCGQLLSKVGNRLYSISKLDQKEYHVQLKTNEKLESLGCKSSLRLAKFFAAQNLKQYKDALIDQDEYVLT